MTKTPWRGLSDDLAHLFRSEEDQEEAERIIREHMDRYYQLGRLAGVVEENARHRRPAVLPLT